MTAPTIVVPLDGSQFAESAVPVAIGLAKTLDARIKLVSAIYELDLIAVEKQPVYAAVPSVTPQDIEAQTDEYLDTLLDRMGHVTDVEFSKQILHGPIAPTLEDYAKQHEPELIVMSTHGRGRLSRLWLGSVADRLVRHVSTPLLLIRPDEDPDVALDGWKPFRRIVVTLDGSERAEASLRGATMLARATGATLVLLRTVPPPFPVQSPYLPDAIAATREVLEAGKDEAERYVEEKAEALKADGLEVETHVTVGTHAASGILEHLDDCGADLVAIATHGRGGVARAVLGSVADKVIRGASIPVLLTRPR